MFASSAIRTDFACLHADDDYLLAYGAARAISTLLSKPELGCITSDANYFAGLQVRGTYVARPLLNSRWNRRLRKMFQNYRYGYYYGLQRSTNVQKALGAVGAATLHSDFRAVPNLGLGFELGIEIAGALLGPLAKSHDVFLMKRVGNVPTHDEQFAADWVVDPKAKSAYDSWRGVLSLHLSSFMEVDKSLLDAKINDALMSFRRALNRQAANRNRSLRKKSKMLLEVLDRRILASDSSQVHPVRAGKSQRFDWPSAVMVFYKVLRMPLRAIIRSQGAAHLSLGQQPRTDVRDLDWIVSLERKFASRYPSSE